MKKTFAELKARTVKGPFETQTTSEGRVFVSSLMAEPTFEALNLNTPTDDDTPADNAELIARLLNFAHAGGVQALEEAAQGAAIKARRGCAYSQRAETRCRAALAILNGGPVE